MKNLSLFLVVIFLFVGCIHKEDSPKPNSNIVNSASNFELVQGTWRYNARLISDPYLLVGNSPINTLSINTNSNCKMILTDSIFSSSGYIWENHYVLYGGFNGCYYSAYGNYSGTYEYIDSIDVIRFNNDSYYIQYVSNDSLLVKNGDYVDYYSRIVSTLNNTSIVTWRVDLSQNDLESNRIGIIIKYSDNNSVTQDTIPFIANNLSYSGTKTINTTANPALIEINIITLPYNGIPIPNINRTFTINTRLVINGTGLISKTGSHTFCYSPGLNCYPLEMINWNTPIRLNQILWE